MQTYNNLLGNIKIANSQNELQFTYAEIHLNQNLTQDEKKNLIKSNCYKSISYVRTTQELNNLWIQITATQILSRNEKISLIISSVYELINYINDIEELNNLDMQIATNSMLDKQDKAQLMRLCKEKLAEIKIEPEQVTPPMTKTNIYNIKNTELSIDL